MGRGPRQPRGMRDHSNTPRPSLLASTAAHNRRSLSLESPPSTCRVHCIASSTMASSYLFFIELLLVQVIRGRALKGEFEQLLALAEEADGVNVTDGMSVPDDLKPREDGLTAIAAAMVKIDARAVEHFARV